LTFFHPKSLRETKKSVSGKLKKTNLTLKGLMNRITQQNHAKRCQFVCCINSHSSCPHIARISQKIDFFLDFLERRFFFVFLVNFARLSTPHQCFHFSQLKSFLVFNPLSTRFISPADKREYFIVIFLKL
jgi:hypothetical protein